jgi:hypothetical protein
VRVSRLTGVERVLNFARYLLNHHWHKPAFEMEGGTAYEGLSKAEQTLRRLKAHDENPQLAKSADPSTIETDILYDNPLQRDQVELAPPGGEVDGTFENAKIKVGSRVTNPATGATSLVNDLLVHERHGRAVPGAILSLANADQPHLIYPVPSLLSPRGVALNDKQFSVRGVWRTALTDTDSATQVYIWVQVGEDEWVWFTENEANNLQVEDAANDTESKPETPNQLAIVRRAFGGELILIETEKLQLATCFQRFYAISIPTSKKMLVAILAVQSLMVSVIYFLLYDGEYTLTVKLTQTLGHLW